MASWILEKRVLGAVICSFLLLAMGTHANALGVAPTMPRLEEYREYQNKDLEIAEKYLQTEANIQYFANLDLEEAEEELRPVILAARNRIVSRYSWVADGISGRIIDVEGNVKRELPRFSELFPEGWEEPVCPVIVDISYYQ